MKKNREFNIIKTSIIGIVTNVFLSIFKVIIGLITKSVAIMSDAINNLTDAVSSIITIIGMKLASKKPDRKHPLGYGRIEYFSALIVASIVLVAGTNAFIEAIKKILKPEDIEITTQTIIILVVAFFAKIILGLYTKKKGKENNSNSLITSGSEAMLDSIVTVFTIISSIIFLLYKINIDGLLGLVISCLIIKTGLEMIFEAVSEMIGKRIDPKLSKDIKKDILKHKEVKGVYDLYLDNYGPENSIGFLHIEVEDTMTALEISNLTRKIQSELFLKYGIAVTVGIYVINTKDAETFEIIKQLKKNLIKEKEILQVHGIYVDKEKKHISFDVVLDFNVDDKKEYYNIVKNKVEGMFEGYTCDIQIDTDISLTDI